MCIWKKVEALGEFLSLFFFKWLFSSGQAPSASYWVSTKLGVTQQLESEVGNTKKEMQRGSLNSAHTLLNI